MARFFVTCILLACTTLTHAFQNEPDGFRGIQWGAPIAENQRELVLIENSRDWKYYGRKKDRMVFEGAELVELAYGYYKGHFSAVLLATEGLESKRALLSAIQAKFGGGVKQPGKLDRYEWSGERTTIQLYCKSLHDRCSLVLRSTESDRAKTQASSTAGAAPNL
ncbi:MAG: hypothetical protein ACE5K1_03455 [Acidiferrobacterales bacterium]